jgi:uncharacterized membrane protein YdbT with pleckstrin-like domain
MAKSYIDSLLGEHERIILTARQHWFILARNITAEITLILVIFIATIVAAVFFPPFLGLIILVGFLLMLLPMATMTRDILNWTHRQFVVTNRRVMQISGVINKEVTDSSLEKVNDLKMDQSALGRMFDYGDIEILTASELGANVFHRIEKPIQFKTALINAKERLERGEVPSRSGDAMSLLERLDQLRKSGTLTEEEFQRKKAELLAKL